MRTKELMLYKHMEHEELLRDMTFLMENCDSDYYNKEDMAGLLFECVNELLELAAVNRIWFYIPEMRLS